MMNVVNPVVHIRCMTYNQAPYIVEAMDGFCMQQTNFSFLAVICDDASTDGEQKVINEYLQKNFILSTDSEYQTMETEEAHIIYAQHKQNTNCFFLVVYLKENHYSQRKPKSHIWQKWTCSAKYIAICEGDDYWTDPLKLQKQVDFLEEHEDYSCCCHRFNFFFEDTNTWTDDYVGTIFEQNPDAEGLEFTNSQNFITRFTQTLTMCYRKSAADKIIWPPYKYGKRDFNFHYHLLKLGKGWCFAGFMGVYRKHNGGVWSRMSDIEGAKMRLECYKDLYKYNHTDNIILESYSEWLDKFAGGYVFPPFYQRRFSKEELSNLFFYFKHCWEIKSLLRPLLRCCKCIAVVLGIIKI